MRRPTLPSLPSLRRRRLFPDPPTTGRGAPWSAVVVALALAAVCLALAVVATVREEPPVVDDRGTTALAAAREYTVSLTSYDHRRLDADFERVRAVATGEFAAEYERTTEQLRPTIEQSRVVATSEVVGAGVESMEDGTVVVLVAVDQVVRATGQAPRTEPNRLRMTLVRPGDTWLVSAVQRL